MKKPNETKALTVKPLAASRRHGFFSAGMIALVIAIVIVLNIAVSLLPTNLTSLDLSVTGIYTMTDTTKEYLASLDKDVELIVMASEEDVDGIDSSVSITRFLQNFSALSDHLTVTYKDPDRYPSVLTEYGCDADSIEVICGDNKTNVDLYDILVPNYSYYYYSGSVYYDSFDGEGQLLSAIDQVVSDASHTIYTTTGHGESDLGTEVSDLLTKNHFTTDSVSLLMEGMPSDCDVLLINQPTSDLTAEEAETITSYLASGGQVEVILADEDFDHPNLDTLLASCGLAVEDGYIGDQSRYLASAGSYLAFLATMKTSSDACDGLSSDSYVLVYNSLGVTTTGEDDASLTVDEFLTTSSSGIAITSETDYTTGTYTIAATATRAYNADGTPDTGEDEDEDSSSTDAETSSGTEPEEEEEGYESRLTVYGCATLLDDSLNESYGSSIVNLQIFINNLNAGFEDVSSVSVSAKSLSTTYNTVSNGGLWGLLYLAVIPLAVIVVAFVRWWRRRRL